MKLTIEGTLEEIKRFINAQDMQENNIKNIQKNKKCFVYKDLTNNKYCVMEDCSDESYRALITQE